MVSSHQFIFEPVKAISSHFRQDTWIIVQVTYRASRKLLAKLNRDTLARISLNQIHPIPIAARISCLPHAFDAESLCVQTRGGLSTAVYAVKDLNGNGSIISGFQLAGRHEGRPERRLQFLRRGAEMGQHLARHAQSDPVCVWAASRRVQEAVQVKESCRATSVCLCKTRSGYLARDSAVRNRTPCSNAGR